MLNYLWLGMIVVAVVLAGIQGNLDRLTTEALQAAQDSVLKIAFPLLGLTVFWLGIMRLAERSGLIQRLARALRPLMRRLFPEVPEDHPAMGSMVLNFAANMLGLNNAATPLGLRAMEDLQKLNPHPGTATNAMCMFLALNTSSLQLIPTTAISLLATAGSKQPTAIVGTALLATAISTLVGFGAARWLQNLRWFRMDSEGTEPEGSIKGVGKASLPTAERERKETRVGFDSGSTVEETERSTSWWERLLVWGYVMLFAGIALRLWIRGVQTHGVSVQTVIEPFSQVAVPFLIGWIVLWAGVRRVRVYEEFVEGAKEGVELILRLIPYLVAMLVAIRMFRVAGGIEWVGKVLGPVLHAVGFPTELLPMALTRPLSGSATIGLLGDLVQRIGGDHLLSRMGATLLGSTETTFYVVAVYFGSVGVRNVRHAVAAGLLADLAGILASVWICRWVWG